ncbi:MAG: Bax inhibitor-1 family protein [Malacoplasma sp.]
MYSDYNTTTPIGARGYSKLQVSMMSKALLVASIGLILTCLIGFLVAYIYSVNPVSTFALEMLSSVFIIISLVCTFVWMAKLQNASNLLSFGTMAIYCIANGIGFGSLFYMLNAQEVMILFGSVGVIFFGTWFISTLVSTKFMMSFGKFLMIATIIYFVFNIGLFLFNLFNVFGMRYAHPNASVGYQWIYLISSAVSGLLSIGYMAYNMNNIQKMDKFLDSTPELKNKYALFFGFMILMSLISIIWSLARILLFSRR